MGHEGNEANKEQYVDNQYVRERLMVSRTKAYEIMREIEGVYEPNAVFRYGGKFASEEGCVLSGGFPSTAAKNNIHAPMPSSPGGGRRRTCVR